MQATKPVPVADRARPTGAPFIPDHVTCNNCGADDAKVLFRAGEAQWQQIVQCNRCALIYASPRAQEPADVLLARKVGSELSDAEKLYIKQRVEKEQLQVRDYSKSRASLNALYPQRGTLLEIGSGFGYLVAAFKSDGWTVIGIDPDGHACEHARNVNHVDARTGTLESVHIPDQSIDVVVMNHVIEHVPDPIAMLKDINRVLKPGGRFVMETPCYDTLMFKLLGRRERSLSCNGHITFYTAASLKAAYEAAGFRLVEFLRVGRSLTLNRLAYNVGVMSKSPAVKRSLESLTRVLGLNHVTLYLNTHDMQRVLLQK